MAIQDQGGLDISEVETLKARVEALEKVARSARYVHSAWIYDQLTRKNGMLQLEDALQSAGM